MPHYFFDPDGNPIDILDWGLRLDDFPSRVFAEDTVGIYIVRTVWHGFVDPALGTRLFAVALFTQRGFAAEVEGFDSKEEALRGHREIVEDMRANHCRKRSG